MGTLQQTRTLSTAAAAKVTPQALLIAFSNPPPGDEAGFNAWYDDEHAPARLTVPGIFNARRYIATSDEGPRYMAMYDLESTDSLAGPDYRRIAEQRSEREKAMLAATPLLDRRVMKLLLSAE